MRLERGERGEGRNERGEDRSWMLEFWSFGINNSV